MFRLWLEVIQLRPETNNKLHFLPIRLCFIKINTYPNPKPTPYSRHPQIWPTPAEFSSNLNQTHLSMLIRVFKIIRKSQVGKFDQGWS